MKLYTPDLQVNKKYEKSTNSDVFSGFYGATVGSLEIDPNAFGGGKISFGTLTIGEDVTTFVADSDSASKAFDKSTINALYYNATEAQTSVLNYSVYGPFSYNTKVKELHVGDNVKAIPHGCFKGTTMNLEELTIENAAIGYDAFNGRNIKIGTLNLGKNVNYVGVVSGGTNNFAWANIGTLNYNSNAVDSNWSASTNGTGMFYFTTIGQLNIGPDVEVIPALWFRAAKIKQDTLTIPCNWS